MKIIVNILGNHAISIALWALVSVGITTIMRENASIQSKNVSTFETRQYSDLEQEYVKDEIAMIRLPSAIRLQSYNVLLTCYANGRDSQSIEFDELLSQHSGHLEFSSNGHILEMHVKSNLDNSYDWQIQFDCNTRQLNGWKPDTNADNQLVLSDEKWSVRLVKITLQ